MKKRVSVLVFTLACVTFASVRTRAVFPDFELPVAGRGTQGLYADSGLDGLLPFEVFDMAVEGSRSIEGCRRDVIAIIDFSKPSTEERLFVVDLLGRKLLYRSLVAHGQGSGDNYATSFSNVEGSHKSSLGFYLTADTYKGKHGYSLRLDGLEKGINDKARQRAIVMHSADYASRSFIASTGRLGRSFGCPALPCDISDEVIDAIKGGCVLFVYADDSDYLACSPILSGYGRRDVAVM